MQRMIDEAGNQWDIDGFDANGEPINPRPVRAQGQGRVITLPMSDKDRRQQARQDDADARAREDQERQREKDRRDALEWAATHNPDGSPKPKPSDVPAPKSEDDLATVRNEAIDKIRLARSLKDRSANGYFTTGFGAGLAGAIGGTPAFDVAKDTETLKNAGALTRIMEMARTNGGKNPLTPLSNADFQALSSSLANLDTGQSDAQYQANVDRVIQLYEQAYQGAGGQDLEADIKAGSAQQRAEGETPESALAAGTLPKDPGTDRSPPGAPPENGPTPPDMAVATGGTRSDYSARLSAQVNSMINAGAGEATINAVLRQNNYPALKPGTYGRAREWMKKTGKRFPLGNTIVDRDVPLTAMERAAASPFAAAVANSADAFTAGTTTALAGEKGRGALDAMKALNPNASLAGMALGGVAGAAGAEAALAARAPAALARFAPRIADALYGGLAGFNSAPEGGDGMGALTGASAGVLGGFVGDRAVRAAGAVTRGVRNPAVQYLRDEGIPLTVGQTVGDSGTIGRTIKGIEDALTSVPGVGSMIDARRMEGLEGFNRAAFRDAAAGPVTATGAEGMRQVRQSVSDAYDSALGPVTINANDPQFIADLAATMNSAGRIPDVQPTDPRRFASEALVNRVEGAIDPATDTISGRGFQEGYRGLARSGRERANSDYGYEVGQVMRQGQDALGEALERQNPGAFGDFIEANAANRRANVLAEALKNAANQGSELVTPAQLNRADVTSTSRLEGKINSAAGNRPFYELATAGQAVLPSKLPNSGTADRLMAAGLLGTVGLGGSAGVGYAAGGAEGAGTGLGAGLATTAALMGGGTRMGQRVLTQLLAERPDLAIRIGDQLQSDLARRLAGAAGAGGSTQLLAAP